jgi:hypothetical protein
MAFYYFRAIRKALRDLEEGLLTTARIVVVGSGYGGAA